MSEDIREKIKEKLLERIMESTGENIGERVTAFTNFCLALQAEAFVKRNVGIE